ncbi:hypothetical protein [Stenotrophomonas tumulicola]|uniref:Phosphatidylinositol diacylglycerol-lyase n=1 Tax=Stenotrophomonas tumulicola TaxID=1685415 RepID=A0A7W3II40_9GAMM|nr:hypothetical protein [Stenotrophomonas tumulicola]MBA8681831.1 hypothetical protein [Stenotrophomonas tumulicola]
MLTRLIHASHHSLLTPLCSAIIALAASAPAHAELARPDHINDYTRTLDELVMIMGHNAFNHDGFLPNQRLTIEEQLGRGVRGFMLDIYKHNGELHVCHGSCNILASRVAPLERDLRTIHDFLTTHPTAIIAIHIESYIQRKDLEDFHSTHPELFQHAFDPTHKLWSRHKNWPDIGELMGADQRLLLIAQDSSLAGRIGGSSAHVMFDQDILVQNTYNIGDTIGQHDFSCSSRWDDIPLDTATGVNGWKRLFLMNHFHKVPELIHGDYDNHWEYIEAREMDRCKRMPNFIAVDSVERGDALEYVEHRNNGGVVAYEGNDAKQNVVCGFSSAVQRDWSMQDGERLGCENDEMRSLRLRGMKKGQRITLHDHPGGTRDDDFGILNIDRDIPWNSPLVLKDLDQTQYSDHFRYLYSGGNGLAGKVSHIKVEPSPVPHSESAAVLLRGNNGTQRISCTFGLTRSDFWNIKKESGCHNDDARSMNILSAKEGTIITVYDSPSGSEKDDYTVIRVKRDLDTVRTVPTFEGDSEDEYLVIDHHHVNGLDGKVSAVRVETP